MRGREGQAAFTVFFLQQQSFPSSRVTKSGMSVSCYEIGTHFRAFAYGRFQQLLFGQTKRCSNLASAFKVWNRGLFLPFDSRTCVPDKP